MASTNFDDEHVSGVAEVGTADEAGVEPVEAGVEVTPVVAGIKVAPVVAGVEVEEIAVVVDE